MLKKAHDILLERYRETGRQQGTGWSALKDDGYIHNHLVWHLQQADRFEEMVALLCEETPDGRNAWYEVRESIGQLGGYIQDLLRALEWTQEKSREHVERNEPIATLTLEVRFLLMLASINSMTNSIPGELMAHLVRCGVWTPEAALVYCRKQTYRDGKLRMIAGALVESGKTEMALSLLREIEEKEEFVSTVKKIAPHLLNREERDGLLMEALLKSIPALDIDTISLLDTFEGEESGDEADRHAIACVSAVTDIAPFLADTEKRDNLLMDVAKTREIHSSQRADWIAKIASLLADAHGLPDETFSSLLELHGYDNNRGGILARFATYMSEEQKREALRAIQEDDSIWTIKYLIEIASLLEDADARQQVLDQTLAIWQAHSDQNATIAMELIQVLSAGNLRDNLITATFNGMIEQVKTKQERYINSLSTAFTNPDTTYQHHWELEGTLTSLSRIFPYLDTAQLEATFVLILELREDAMRMRILNDITRHLVSSNAPARLLKQALAIAQNIETLACRIQALVVIAPYLLAPDQTAQVKRIIRAVVPNPQSWGDDAVIEMADPPQGHRSQSRNELDRILSTVVSYIEDEQSAKKWLECNENSQPFNFFFVMQIAPLLIVIGQIDLAIAIADRLAEPSKNRCSKYLSLFCRILQASGHTEASLAFARKFRSAYSLMQMIPFVQEDRQVSILLEVLSLSRRIDDRPDRERATATIVAVLAKMTSLDRALHMLGQVEMASARLHAFMGILPNLVEDEQRTQFCSEALSAGREAPEHFSYVLDNLCPYLKDEQLIEAMTIVLKARDSYRLVSIYPYLTKAQLQEALPLILPSKQSDGLAYLYPYLREEQLREVLTTLLEWSAESPQEHDTALLDLIPYVQAPTDRSAIASHFLQRLHTHSYRTLAQLVPCLTEEQLMQIAPRVLHEISRMRTTPQMATILHPFIPQVDILFHILENLDDRNKVSALQIIAPYLSEDRLLMALGMIPEIDNFYYQGNALAGLVPYLSEVGFFTALTLVGEIEGIGRAIALASIAPRLTDKEVQDNALAETLEIVRRVSDNELELDDLELITNRITQLLMDRGFIREALALVMNIKNRLLRERYLIGILPHMATSDGLEEALSLTRQIQDTYKRDGVLIHLLPSIIKTGSMEDAISMAVQIQDFRRLIECLTESVTRNEQIELLLHVADRLPNESAHCRARIAEYLIKVGEPLYAFDVAQKLTGFDEQYLILTGEILPHLTHIDQFAALLSGYSSMMPDTTRWDSSAIEYIPPLLAHVSPHEFYPVWTTLSQRVARFERKSVLKLLPDLIPTFLKFGQEGQEGMPEEVVEIMHDMERWWP